MAEVLVLVEHAEGALKKVSTELITAARALGEPSAVVAGPAGTAAKLADALAAAGAEKIYVAESDDIDGYLVTPKVDVLAALVESHQPGSSHHRSRHRGQRGCRSSGRTSGLRIADRRHRDQG